MKAFIYTIIFGAAILLPILIITTNAIKKEPSGKDYIVTITTKRSDRHVRFLYPQFRTRPCIPGMILSYLLPCNEIKMFYRDSKRFVDKAKTTGVDMRLEAWDDMPHLFHLFGLNELPEKEKI